MTDDTQRRPVALCLLLRDGSFLVEETPDPVTGHLFHRPPGGGIEPGETPAAAAIREIGEELRVRIQRVEPFAVLDNSWAYGGRPMHETVHLFIGMTDDPGLASGATPDLIEPDGQRFRTSWRPLRHDAAAALPPLQPSGLSGLLARLSG